MLITKLLATLVAVLALASASEPFATPTTPKAATAPEAVRALAVSPDCLMQGPATTHTGNEAAEPQIDVGQTATSTQGGQPAPQGKPDCDGCEITWSVMITWPVAGAGEVAFNDTVNPYTVTAGQSTGPHQTSQPITMVCDSSKALTASLDGAGTNDGTTTVTYTCTVCQ